MKKMQLVGLCAVCSLAVLLAGCSKHSEKTSGYINIKGSDTMVHLVTAWAEDFMGANPKLEVSVTGGGSGTGIAALLNGMTDICAASRTMKGKEKKLAQQKNINPKEIVVARDGIAVIINPKNVLNSLTIEQIKKIYTGAYVSWKQVGGPDKAIVVISRDSSSGTYVFFQEHALGKEDYTEKAMLMPATSSIVQTVSSNVWAIGYVGMGYALKAKNKVKMIQVKTEKSAQGVTPSEESVIAGAYPISRTLQLYTNGEPKGTVRKFIDFALSMQGQKIVSDTGYVAVR